MAKVHERLADLRAAQKSGKYLRCPRCGFRRIDPDKPVHSHLANIMICEECGMTEDEMAFQGKTESLYSWAALKPRRRVNDFEALPSRVVLERVLKEQKETLMKLFDRFNAGEEPAAVRFDAFEMCPGLRMIWTDPFQVRYDCKNKDILISFRKTDAGNEMSVDLIEK